MSTVVDRPPLWRYDDDEDAPAARPQIERWAVGGLLALVALVNLVNIGGFPAFFDDEGTYLQQVWAVQHFEALAPYTYWYDHPPLGWIQIAGLSWIPSLLFPHAPALFAARVAMVVFTLATAFLIYVLSKRIGLRPAFAGVAVLLWALSPLVLYQSRQVYLDNVALPWLLGAFVLATGSRRSLWSHTAAGLAFGVAVLSKETVAIVLPALLYAVWHYSYKPTRAFSMMGVFMGAVITCLAYPLYAALKKELLPGPHHVSLWDALYFQFHGRASSGVVWQTGSESHYALENWLTQDHVLLMAGVAAAVATLFSQRLRAIGLAVVMLVAVILKPGYLPWMYIIAVLPFLAIALAAVADKIWSVHHGAQLVVTVALSALVVTWVPGLMHAMTTNENPVHGQVVAWAKANLPKDSRIVVDATYWNDMVRAGWQPNYGKHGVIWNNKVDEDSSAIEKMPNGWRDIDYFVDTTHLDSNDPNNPAKIVNEGLKHTRVLATFGRGEATTTIRQVIP